LGKVNLPWKAFWAEAEPADAQMAINPNVAIAMMRVNLAFMVASFLDLNFAQLFGASFLERTSSKEHLSGREGQRFKRRCVSSGSVWLTRR
jgi:hypothetical protein